MSVTPRENVQVKGRRLLTEGRLTLVSVERHPPFSRAPIVATCRGDSGKVYDLGYDTQTREWRCNCEARSECSHLVALKLVTLEPARVTA